METDSTSMSDLKQEIQELKQAQAVAEAANAGAQSTQAATLAGDTAAQTATHAGTWSTMMAGAVAFVVGIFLALAFVAVAKD
jgi:hypothetical protein